jgi:hypothetical protein
MKLPIPLRASPEPLQQFQSVLGSGEVGGHSRRTSAHRVIETGRDQPILTRGVEIAHV